MTAKEQFLTNQQRYQPLILPQRFSDEEMVRDWTLSRRDCEVVNKYRKQYRLGFAIQLCAMRLYGRFLNQLHDLSPRVISYLSSQLDLPPTLTVEVPEREATVLEHRNNILKYLGFHRFDDKVEADLDRWIEEHAQKQEWRCTNTTKRIHLKSLSSMNQRIAGETYTGTAQEQSCGVPTRA